MPVQKRMTVFDDMEKELKKKNYPAAGKYDKVEVATDRAKMHSDMSKSEKANYLDSSMRHSLENPGVGSYNSHHDEDKRADKWIEKKS